MAARKETAPVTDEATPLADDAPVTVPDEGTELGFVDEPVESDEPVAEDVAAEPEIVPAEVAAPDVPKEADMDENMPWPVPTGSTNTFGVDPGSQLGCPQLGSVDGAAAQVIRLLGLGDTIVYTQAVADAVAALQEMVGETPTGNVDMATWAHLLPELSVGCPVSPEVGLLRAMLGLPRAGEFDSEVEGLVRMLQAEMAADRTGAVGHPEWAALLGVSL